MDLAVVQRLVCPEQHASTPLVVRADVAEHGRLQRGALGCPSCGKEWSVNGGIAAFGARRDLPDAPIDATAIAAFLGLTEPKLVVTDGVPPTIVVALVREYAAGV